MSSSSSKKTNPAHGCAEGMDLTRLGDLRLEINWILCDEDHLHRLPSGKMVGAVGFEPTFWVISKFPLLLIIAFR